MRPALTPSFRRTGRFPPRLTRCLDIRVRSSFTLLFACLLLCFLAFHAVVKQEFCDLKAAFNASCNLRISAIEREIENRAALLRVTQNLFREGEERGLRALPECLREYPQNRCFGFLVYWFPPTSSGTPRAFSSGPLQLGIVAQSEAGRLRQLADTAQASGHSALSPPFRGTSGQLLLAYAGSAAVGAGSSAGAVVLVFELREVVEPVVAGLDPDTVVVSIVDATKGVIVYPGPTPPPAVQPLLPFLTESRTLHFGDRTWNLTFRAAPSFLPIRALWQRGLLLLACVLLGIALQALVHRLLADAGIPAEPVNLQRRLRPLDALRFQTDETVIDDGEDRYRHAFTKAAIGMAITGLHGRHVEANERWCAIAGYSRSELMGMNSGQLVHPDDRPARESRIGRLLAGSTRDCAFEHRIVRKDGTTIWVRSSISPFIERQRITGLICLSEDVTARKEAEQRLEYQAFYDVLTGLANRRLFTERFREALTVAERRGTLAILLYIDLDGFKSVNDTLGHSIGDLFLREVAERIRGCVRTEDTAARIGGDEFAIVVPGIVSLPEVELLACGILTRIAAPYTIQSHVVSLTASIGISVFPEHARDLETLLGQADTAMYAAKRAGKNRVAIFDAQLGEQVRERGELERELRGALSRSEIQLHYQPQFDLLSRRIVRFEALARWTHPKLGSIPPGRFIPIAEETGFIVPLGAWVMERACARAATWQTLADAPVQVAINVSTVQFVRDDFVDLVVGILDRTGLLPALLHIELNESVLMSGFEESAAKMNRLRAMGVAISVDDFGTGGSALSDLPRLPFDGLKVNRYFVNELGRTAESRAMIQSLISLARNLGMNVVVEGVETPDQMDIVGELGCDEVQGFLLGKPGPEPELLLQAMNPPEPSSSSLQALAVSLQHEASVAENTPPNPSGWQPDANV